MKRIEYEEELNKVKLNENLKKYYQERPEKKEEILRKLYSLRDKIVNDEEIGNFYKKSFLSSIEKNIQMLNNREANGFLEIAIPALTFLFGFIVRGKLEKFFQDYNKDITSYVAQTIREELGNLYEHR